MNQIYQSCSVYGVQESNADDILDVDWFKENFPSLRIFATTLMNDQIKIPIYGIEAFGYDSELCENHLKEVQRLNLILCEYNKRLNQALPSIGMFPGIKCITDDFNDEELCYYTPFPHRTRVVNFAAALN